MHRQAHHARCDEIGAVQTSGNPARLVVGRLAMQGYRVMDSCGNVGGSEGMEEGIAIRHLNRKLRPDTISVGTYNQAWYCGDIFQESLVTLTKLETLLNFLIETLQLGEDDGTLQGIHTPTNADTRMPIALALTMHADFPAGESDGIITCKDRPTIAITP